jgi:cytochrome c-type biogenesis protein CcmF
VGRNKRRYGGYIIHAGIVLMFLGFAGEGFKLEETVLLKPGQSVTVGAFTARLDSLKVTDDGRKQMFTATMTVLKDGQELTEMYPARWYFRKHEDQPTTEVAIRRSFAEDVYIVMPEFDAAQQSASIEVVVNPLVNWVWFGFGILAMGTFLALLPEATFAFATAKLPADAATASMVALLLVLAPGFAHAQHVESPQNVPLATRTPLEREAGRAIVCMCGTCGRKLVGECECGYAAQMREEIATLVKQGKTKPDILAHFVQKYGSQEPLAEPINEGFNRLAWLAPYMAGLAGLGLLVLTARRWTKPAPAAAGVSTLDPALDQRLDDELRDLD